MGYLETIFFAAMLAGQFVTVEVEYVEVELVAFEQCVEVEVAPRGVERCQEA